MHGIKACSNLVPPILACLLVCGNWAGQGTCEAANDITPKPQKRTPSRPKAPYRVLYSNDTTNILTCLSPYHGKGQPFTEEMLRATVDEAAGVDVHLLQPGLCWIPWWKSKVYPAEEHYRWFTERTGLKADSFGQYMLDGGDMVKAFVERCREKGQAPFISLRLNDGHHLDNAGKKASGAVWISRFYEEHPEYRRGPDLENWSQRVHNWAIPAVREHKFAFIREICEQYDIDGFELDFMRFPGYFQLDKTSKAERCRIMTEFVRRVRELLDRTARAGQHRWLCARVPCFLYQHGELGINLPTMVKAGLDMVNATQSYWTQQQNDLAEIRRLVPDAALYLELTHTTTPGARQYSYRRMTDHQLYTGAHLGYAHGADGISLFNFVYYREHLAPELGPYNEPPFYVIARLDEPEWLARQPQWYVMGQTWLPKDDLRHMPRHFRAGQTHEFKVELIPTAAHTNDGVLRIMTNENSSDCKWAIKLNDVNLTAIDFVAKPINHPYDAGLGNPDQYACFACPRSIVKNGKNDIQIRLDQGPEVMLIYLDLVLP